MAGAGGGGPRRRQYAKEIGVVVVTAVWSRILPPGRRRQAPPAPSERVQRTMNLIMPLRFPTLAVTGDLARAIFEASDQLLAGLSNVGTVHFARFVVVEGNLCMFSEYDGDFSAYIRDFVATLGSTLDAIMACVKDPPPTPVDEFPEEFVEWVRERDAFQMTDDPTDLISRDLGTLQRDTLLVLHRNRNVQLAIYRAYPGFSAAQIRDRLSLGW
jgi:alkanesulfonate monooxygenase SsuD/methylene tetrahydromethanopterin reductase-like flavin-dependent oxidoreductase (luciferase family)